MNIDYEIEHTEKALTALRERKAAGFFFAESYSDNYNLEDNHTIVFSSSGDLAGIVVDMVVMEKYMESLK